MGHVRRRGLCPDNCPMSSLRAFLHRTLPQVWQRRGWAARLLWPLSRLYALAWRRRQRRAMQANTPHLPVPVLVVGNVIAGGAGKTPTTIAVVQHFAKLGVKTGVLSRGHGRHRSAPACVTVTAETPAALSGDEPLLIQRHTNVPLVVGADRLHAAHCLLRQYPGTQLLICDDGLQHLALPRNGEICVMDERGIGNGWLLPAGPLREPWPRRTTLLLQTAAVSDALAVPALPPSQPVYQARRLLAGEALRADGQSQALAQWASIAQPVRALAGIARPERFFSMLRAAGLHLAETLSLPDHASAEEMLPYARRMLDQGLPLLCTEKDAVKLWPHLPQVWAVPLVLQPEPTFFVALTDWWRQQRSPSDAAP